MALSILLTMLSFNWKIITGDENDNYSTGILAEHHGADLILMQELDASMKISTYFKLSQTATPFTELT